MMWLVLFSALVLAQGPDAGRSAVSAPYVDRVLTGADLEGRSPEELVLMRNTPEAIVAVTWKLILNGRTCATVRDHNDYWRVKKIFLISGHGQKQKAVAALKYESEEFPGSRASAWFVRLRDGRAGLAMSDVSEASDSGCESGETITYAMDQGRLRKKETKIEEPPCPQ